MDLTDYDMGSKQQKKCTQGTYVRTQRTPVRDSMDSEEIKLLYYGLKTSMSPIRFKHLLR